MTDTVSGAVSEALDSGRPFLLVIAGPNGSGKSTFHDAYVSPLGLPFVNADRIALAMNAASDSATIAGYEAAKLAEVERRLLVGERKSFCMETFFSDPRGEKVRFLQEAQQAGYIVVLVFIGLDGPELSLGRVIQRVAAGGHDVPTVKLRKRFPRSVRNLWRALRFVDHAFLFDNSSRSVPFRPVSAWASGKKLRVWPPEPAWANPDTNPADRGNPSVGRSRNKLRRSSGFHPVRNPCLP